jgi:phage/plasmid-like protein (TIGR03299 family)
MAHNIEKIAFLGSRADVWHHIGSEMVPGMPLEVWAEEAGLNWSAVKVPALADCSVLGRGPVTMRDRSFVVRSDTAAPLGYVSGEDDTEGYRIVQPLEVLDWFQRYIGVDDRFELDTAMSLKGGALIAVTAKYNGVLSVLGEDHTARLLMTTSFDGSASTVNQMTMTRVVCNNTLNVALTDKRAAIKTRHSSVFDAAKVGAELAGLAASVEGYKAMAEAMVAVHLSARQVSDIFKQLLAIPFDAKQDDISGKKLNVFRALGQSYADTVSEGTQPGTAWTVLNAVTRYVDHQRTTRGGASPMEARFLSAQFGSGAALKSQAHKLLLAA